MTRPRPIDIAIRLLALGLCVIPLKARDKRPAIASWKEFQTRKPTVAEVHTWFTNDQLNVGIVTGAISNVVVIDADTQEMVNRVGQQYPSPTRSKTSKGAHYLYRHPGHTVSNRAKIVGLGLDVRGDGGYIVAPGSIHPSGIEYEAEGNWSDLSDLPVFDPSWLGEARLKEPRGDYRTRIEKYLDGTPGAIQGSGGDPFTFRVACKLVRGYDLTDAEALEYLLRWNSKCNPPWSLQELQAKVKSARASGTGAFGYLLSGKPSHRPQTQLSQPGQSVEEGGAGSLQEMLAKTDKGQVRKTPGNLAKILRLDPTWGPNLSLNEMTRDVLLSGVPQTDSFVDQVQELVEDRYQVAFGREEVAAKILAQANGQTVHPVRDWLQSLPEWDGVERIHLVPSKILNADGHALYPHFIRCTMVGAVRRVFHPGTKVDTIPVLVGEQGFFKSTFWRVLAGPQWFSDSPIDLDSKDGPMVLHRVWFTELGEIDHITSMKAAERVKGFSSSSSDTFRPPFARSVAVFPRSCMIVGTTNREKFLNDPTGSRRFWPIKILRPVNIAQLTEWQAQLWAEAMDLYAHAIDHWLSSDLEAERVTQAQDFECEDPWDGQLDMAVDALVKTGRLMSDGFTIAEIMNMMSIPTTQQNRASSMKLAEILKRKGWAKKRFMVFADRRVRWAPDAPDSPVSHLF